MILDGHIHVLREKEGTPEEFVERLRTAGVDGGVVFSIPPWPWMGEVGRMLPEERLEDVFRWADASEHLYPFFFIDPVENDAIDQVRRAVDRGVYGFKIACRHHDPGHPEAMKTYAEIAAAGKPILFHSGILYDGGVSSAHNHPILFEPLLEVRGLKFALAHISWPWWNECVAIYGKFWNTAYSREDRDAEMFIDTTPGAPAPLRAESLNRVFAHPYVKENVFFGTDGHANAYNIDFAKEWIQGDTKIYESMGFDEAQREKIFSKNLLRFLGVD